MRRVITPVLAALIAASATAALAVAHGDNRCPDKSRHGTYSIGLWGDLPYATRE